MGTYTSSYSSSNDTGFWLIAVLVVALICGGVGYAIGSGKGRGTAGFWLGFLLSWIGWIIVAVMEPSYEEQQRRADSVQSRGSGDGQAPQSGVPYYPPPGLYASTPTPPNPGNIRLPARQELMAEAIRRNPSLNNPSDPEMLRQLNLEIEALAVEYVTKAELEELQRSMQASAELDAVRQLGNSPAAMQITEQNAYESLMSEDESVALAAVYAPATPRWALRRYQWEGKNPTVQQAVADRLATPTNSLE